MRIEMKLRPYTPADLEPLVDLFTEAVHVGAATHYDERQRLAWAPIPADLDRWRARFDSTIIRIAERDDAVLGFISYELNGHIDLLYTSPQHHRTGVASALYVDVERTLASREVAELFTEASHLARPFFASHGFFVEEEEHVTRQGVVLPRFRMRKRLK